MTKKFIIPLVALGVAAGSFASILFANNNKTQFIKVEATPTTLIFNASCIDDGYIDDESGEGYKYFEFYMNTVTPLGNVFETNVDGGFPCVYGDTAASVKTNNRILELTDTYGYGYFSMNFQFELSLVTFDHITVHGYFEYGAGHTVTDYITYDDVEETGMITVSLSGMYSGYITTIDVVYSC